MVNVPIKSCEFSHKRKLHCQEHNNDNKNILSNKVYPGSQTFSIRTTDYLFHLLSLEKKYFKNRSSFDKRAVIMLS